MQKDLKIIIFFVRYNMQNVNFRHLYDLQEPYSYNYLLYHQADFVKINNNFRKRNVCRKDFLLADVCYYKIQNNSE